jgi:hypothetical protein
MPAEQVARMTPQEIVAFFRTADETHAPADEDRNPMPSPKASTRHADQVSAG